MDLISFTVGGFFRDPDFKNVNNAEASIGRLVPSVQSAYCSTAIYKQNVLIQP